MLRMQDHTILLVRASFLSPTLTDTLKRMYAVIQNAVPKRGLAEPPAVVQDSPEAE